MNRHDRRAAQKLSRDAAPDQVFPGGHRPIPLKTAELMTSIMDVLRDHLPGFHISLFLAEKEPSEGRELPRFNYISTAERADMVAVLKAFVAKNDTEGPKIDKIMDPSPSGLN